MKSPIKRPVTLRIGYLYELKDGRKGILVFINDTFGETYFRIPDHFNEFIIVKNWKNEIVKLLRRKTNSE